jgi:exodeoxyribonuclease VII small subunit
MAAKKEIEFEEAINQLEGIVDELEEGNLKLKQALDAFQKGIELSRICAGQLESAEKKIDLLVKGNNGSISVKSAKIMEETNE